MDSGWPLPGHGTQLKNSQCQLVTPDSAPGLDPLWWFFRETDEAEPDTPRVENVQLFKWPPKGYADPADRSCPSVHRTLQELELVDPTISLSLAVGHDYRRYHRFHVLNQLHRESLQFGDPRRFGLICPLLLSRVGLLFGSLLPCLLAFWQTARTRCSIAP